MRFSIVNLGCKVNRVESDDAAADLLAAGWTRADADADLVVVNTCTVTGEADKKTRKAVRHALRENAGARVIVTGCAAAIDPKTYEAMSERVEVVLKSQLAGRIEEVARANAAHDSTGEAAKDAQPVHLRVGGAFPTRVGIKVQDGCNHACTYCIVHVARGRATSMPADRIVSEAAAYGRAGVREIVLSGINLGSYRAAGERGEFGLAGLLEQLLAAAPQTRFRLSSIEPMDVSEDLIELMASSNGRICRHLHLPVQSGSTKVLREMARPYDAETFASLVGRLRSAMPSLSLTTDIIAGFPGETEADFMESASLARACGFSKMHVFPYSMREGTPAAARADQVDPEVKAARCAELRSLSDELRAVDRASRAGAVELALVETDGVATTESYYDVEPPAGAARGSLVEVRL